MGDRVFRHRRYQTGDELYAKAQEYFDLEAAKGDDEFLSLGSLVLHLGINKSTFARYGRDAEYADVIEWCRTKIELFYEKRLLGNKPVGAIFALKAQHGWTDQPRDVKSVKNYVYLFADEAEQLRVEGKLKSANAGAAPLKLIKGSSAEQQVVEAAVVTERKRGRPKGSKNKKKITE